MKWCPKTTPHWAFQILPWIPSLSFCTVQCILTSTHTQWTARYVTSPVKKNTETVWYKYISYMVYNLKRHHTIVPKWIFKCCEVFRKNKWQKNTTIWTLYTATGEQYYYSYTELSRTWIPTQVKVYIIKLCITYRGTCAETEVVGEEKPLYSGQIIGWMKM